jgi:uncharacterized lipoprotein YajG
MKEAKHRLFVVASAVAVAATLLAGCNKPDDPINQASKTQPAAGAASAAASGAASLTGAPSLAEVKAIAEEGFHLRPADRDELCRNVRIRR